VVKTTCERPSLQFVFATQSVREIHEPLTVDVGQVVNINGAPDAYPTWSLDLDVDNDDLAVVSGSHFLPIRVRCV